jgi:transposase
MPRAYSVDLRARVMVAVADGGSMAEVAQRFSVSVDAIYDWKHRQDQTHSLAPSTGGGGRPRRLTVDQDRLLQDHVDAVPDATIAELQSWLASELRLVVGWGTVCRTLERLDRPRKKSLIASERNAEQRAVWEAGQSEFAVDELVFLDETSTQTTLTRTHGRAPRGQRLVAAIPRNHGANVTCLAALTATGVGPSLVFEGALNGPVFAQWVTEQLAPTLRPGQIVILDNLSVHKHAGARAAIEGAGCHLRFLPAYSPDFNPIELVFSRLKAQLRKVGARAVDALMEAIGDGLNAILAADARACFRHAGYR